MSRFIVDSQLQTIGVTRLHSLWIEYFVHSLPLSSHDVKKKIKKRKNPVHVLLNATPSPKATVTQIKSALSKFETQGQVELALGNMLELKSTIDLNQLELAKIAAKSDLSTEKKEIQEYLDIIIMRNLISISFDFKTEFNFARHKKPSIRFPSQIWAEFYYFVVYFLKSSSEKTFADFLTIIEPIINEVNDSMTSILMNDNSNPAHLFIVSLINPLLNCLDFEIRIKKREKSISFSFFWNLVKTLFDKKQIQYCNELLFFFQFEAKKCAKLSNSDQKKLNELSLRFMLLTKQDGFLTDNEIAFRIGLACSTINMTLNNPADDSFITYSIDFIQWAISTFPLNFLQYPNSETTDWSIQNADDSIAVPFILHENNPQIKNKYTFDMTEDVTHLSAIDQLALLKDHLKIMQPVINKTKNPEVFCTYMADSYSTMESIQSQHVFIAFVILLFKESTIKIADGKFYFIFDFSLFDLLISSYTDRLTSFFIRQLRSLVFTFSVKMCQKNEDGRNLILISIGKQLVDVQSDKVRALFFVTNLIPLFFQLMKYNLVKYGIAENLLSLMNQFSYSTFGRELFEFLQQMILSDPPLYFKHKTIIDMFMYNSSNDCFTKTIYQTLLEGLFYCYSNKSKALNLVLTYISEFLRKILKNPQNSLEPFEALSMFKSAIMKMKTANTPFQLSSDIFSTILTIPIELQSDDVLLDTLYFIQFIGCLRSSASSDILINTLKGTIITPEIIDSLVSIIFDKKSKFGDIEVIQNCYGLKPLIVVTQNLEYEQKVIEYLVKLVANNETNSYQCSIGGVVGVTLIRFLVCPIPGITELVMAIIKKNPSPVAIKDLISVLSSDEAQSSDLIWIVEYFKKLSNEKYDEPTSYIKLNDPIIVQQIDGTVLNDKFSVSISVFMKENIISAIFQLSSYKDVPLFLYIKDKYLHVQIETETTQRTDYVFSSILVEPNQWVPLTFQISKNVISLNGAEEKSIRQMPTFLPNCGLIIGNKDLTISKTTISRNNSVLFELDPKSFQPPKTLIFSSEKCQNLITFEGYLIKYHCSIAPAFSEGNMFVPLFRLFENTKYLNMFFSIFSSIFENNEVQNHFYSLKAINQFACTLDNIHSQLTAETIDILYEMYLKISFEQLSLQFLIKIWLSSSIFLRAPFEVAVKYTKEILPQIYKSKKCLTEELFSQANNFTDICISLSNLKYGEEEMRSLVDIGWSFLKDILLHNQTVELYSALLAIMSACPNEYLSLVVVRFIEDRMVENDSAFHTALKDASSYSFFILHLQKKNVKIQRICLRCIKLLCGFSANKGKVVYDVLNIIGSIKFRKKKALKIVEDCLELLFKYNFIEILPLISYLTTLIDVSDGLNVYETLVKKVTDEICDQIIQYVPFWSNWILIICQNATPNGDCSVELKSFLNKFLHEKTMTSDIVSKTFHNFDVISILTGVDYTNIKKEIMTFYVWPANIKDLLANSEEIYRKELLSFISIVFSLLFIRIQLPKQSNDIFQENQFMEKVNESEEITDAKKNSMKKKKKKRQKQILDYKELQHCSERLLFKTEDTVFSIRINHKGKWDDQGLALMLKVVIVPYAQKYEQQYLSYANNFKITAQAALAYIMGVDERVGMKNDFKKIRETIQSIEPTVDGAIVHQMIGIFLKCAGLNDPKSASQNPDIQYLYDVYNLIDDSEDSPALDLFLFEEYILNNRNNMLALPNTHQ